MVLLIITITISSNFIGALTALFFTNHSVELYSDFVNHSYDYRPNWTPLSPVTITNHNYNKILKSDWFSTALISALIGQFNRTVRVMPK